MLGAKGIYTGIVTQANVNQTNWTEGRTECTSYEASKKFFKKCLSQRNYNVQCAKRIASFEFTPKLTEVETGRVVYANKVFGTAVSKACEDNATPIASEFDLLQTAKQEAVNKFKAEIAPSYITFSILLMESAEGIASTEAEKKFRSGLDYAKNSRLDRACELWGEARVASPNSPSLLYSLGICAEVTGEPEAAIDLYRKADRLLNRPDGKITTAIARCANAVQSRQKLKDQIAK